MPDSLPYNVLSFSVMSFHSPRVPLCLRGYLTLSLSPVRIGTCVHWTCGCARVLTLSVWACQYIQGFKRVFWQITKFLSSSITLDAIIYHRRNLLSSRIFGVFMAAMTLLPKRRFLFLCWLPIFVHQAADSWHPGFPSILNQLSLELLTKSCRVNHAVPSCLAAIH